MSAKHRTEFAADLIGGYAQSRSHNAQSISSDRTAGALAGRLEDAGYPVVAMATLLSVNLGRSKASAYTDTGVTGIDKRPSEAPVELRDPGRASGTSGAAGDAIGDPQSHGGTDQAVYAFAREDLDQWQAELGRPLTNGVFGENLTTLGLDVNAALIGERWQVGDTCVLEVTSPRIPCRTFAGWLQEQLWVKRFTERGAPGPYLRVITPGLVRAGDSITVVHRPEHDVTVEMMFRALTTEKVLQPQLAAAGDALPEVLRRRLLVPGT
jgi:MOSC domain-containing protein YiiM